MVGGVVEVRFPIINELLVGLGLIPTFTLIQVMHFLRFGSCLANDIPWHPIQWNESL